MTTPPPRKFAPLLGLILIVSLSLSVLLSLSYGEYPIPLWEVVKTILGFDSQDNNYELVVWSFRLPRVLLALGVGMALATAGAILQGITRNELADPGLLGINGGAGVMAMAYLTKVESPNVTVLPWVAFSGALGAASLIYILAWKEGSSPTRLILIGVGLASSALALTNYLLIQTDIHLAQEALIWLTGSVYGRDWDYVGMIFSWLMVIYPLAIWEARPLNLLTLGDDMATGLGLRVEYHRTFLLIIASALAAAATAAAGTIGFIGFVAPHIARRLIGPAHAELLVITALIGGLLLVVADFIGHTIMTPNELPVGVITAMLGAPYFLYLLYRKGS